ncbi:glycosyltransferase [Agromyces protaetiae]|uniref:glycosyltransferase n=1 Tax=Agromyces protaetiae TaxID=2509455 RepID=UPI0013EC8FFA|nr:glycosyltransferase [Agromyces protaetiae]
MSDAFTVVVPAHDEEALIDAALRNLLDGDGDGARVVVVANGCSDATAAKARGHGERVEVIELDVPSKIAALNAGLARAECFPVVFVDADVTVSGRTLDELVARVEADPGVLAAAPALSVRPSPSWWVRQYYRVWALTDYRADAHVGSGVYLLTRGGADRLGSFPDLIADDLYVRQLFAPAERLAAADLRFEVDAPRSIRSLVARNARIAAGNRQLAMRYPDLAAAPAARGARSLAGRVWRHPSLWPGFAVYTAVYLAAHRRAERMLASASANASASAHAETAAIAWNRDETTRRAGA